MAVVDLAAAVVFWGGLALVAYVYVGYPLTLRLWPARPLRKTAAAEPPAVTVVIAAFNERVHIEDTVRNKLAQDYPASRLDIIVVSDGSVDGTDDIVRRIGDPRVTLLRQEPRQGKTMALNRALEVATGEIIVFSDANSTYQPDTVRRLVAAFEAPEVGYVTGQLHYLERGETAVGSGSGAYMRYENWLRQLESRVGSVVGVNGGVDAVRRRLYAPMRADHLPDFILPLRVVAQGARVLYVPDAVSSEYSLDAQADEYRMRVRVSLRALHALSEMRVLLSPRFGLFAFQLLVHKWLRYLVALPLLAVLLANVLLAGTPGYAALLGLQLLCYTLAGIGWASGGRVRWKPVFVPFYFCLINVAAAVAFVRFLSGERMVLWAPRKGA
jgi:cellulose synthase/poly-beta-1,6-N-acetylglucosamine synthase-like glycosyltransferase